MSNSDIRSYVNLTSKDVKEHLENSSIFYQYFFDISSKSLLRRGFGVRDWRNIENILLPSFIADSMANQ